MNVVFEVLRFGKVRKVYGANDLTAELTGRKEQKTNHREHRGSQHRESKKEKPAGKFLNNFSVFSVLSSSVFTVPLWFVLSGLFDHGPHRLFYPSYNDSFLSPH